MSYRNVEVLSLSDHRPIWAQVTLPSATSSGDSRDSRDSRDSSGDSRDDSATLGLRVASHNVQEMVDDGVSTYVCSMECVRGSRGSGATAQLTSAMLSKPARARHTQRIVDMLRSQLGVDGAGESVQPLIDAVCLQEVDRELLKAIQAEAKSTGWSVHANASAQEPELGTGRCSSITAVVSREPPMRVLPDVVVEYTDAATKRVNTRRHAAVVLASRVALVSVHVRHCKAKGSEQPSNSENIEQTERAVVASCGSEGCFCVAAVGDWNGSVSGTDEIEVGLCLQLVLPEIAFFEVLC